MVFKKVCLNIFDNIKELIENRLYEALLAKCNIAILTNCNIITITKFGIIALIII